MSKGPSQSEPVFDKAAFTSVHEAYLELGTSHGGLSSEEAKRRLRRYGPNVLPSGKKITLIEKFLAQFKNLFNVILLVASALSFLSGYAYQDPGSFGMGMAILGVVILNSFFSLIQEYRAERALQAISRLVPSNAKVIRDGHLKEVNIAEIVPGDIVALEEGDRIPADARLTSAFETSVDNSILTGESEPQRRFATMARGTPVNSITDYHNIVFAGTAIVSGVARGIVIYTGKATQFGKIVSLSRGIKEPLSALQREIDYTAKVDFMVSILVGAIFFAVAMIFVNLTVIDSLLFAIGIMVCLVPEGFQLTVSLSLALTALAMSKRNVVVKRLSSVETLGSVTVMCVDKTGTITSGEMMVSKLWASGEIFEITGDGFSPKGFVTLQGRKASALDKPLLELFKVAALCNNAKLLPPSDRIPRWSVLGDPTDGAFMVFAEKGDFNLNAALAENPRIGLIPFDSNRRMMTSVHGSRDGKAAVYTKGAPLEVLNKCSMIYQNEEYLPLDDEMRKAIGHQMDEFAIEGFRVIAMATRNLTSGPREFTPEEVERDMTFLGLAALHDPPRPKVEAAVSEARRAGIRVIMVTGDHEFTAEAIAKRIGIVTSPGYIVVSGYELAKMSDDELGRILDEREVVFARITPEQKLRIVQALKSKGEIVAVTGDGVNDAPALMEAEVGIAMGVGGADVARESADMVLLDNNFISIVEGVRLGRGMFDNLKKFVYYVFSHNWAELVAFLAFVLLKVPLPLLVVQVLAIDLGMDVLPSLALVMEPPEPGVMTKSPRRAGSRLIDTSTMVRACYVGIIMSTGGLLCAFRIWTSGGWAFGQNAVNDPRIYARGTTAVLAGIMAGQLGNLFSARSSASAFRLNPARNKWIIIGAFSQVAILMALIYVPFLQPLFNTAPLSTLDWIYLYSLAPFILLLEEGRKAMTRLIRRA